MLYECISIGCKYYDDTWIVRNNLVVSVELTSMEFQLLCFTLYIFNFIGLNMTTRYQIDRNNKKDYN